MTLSGFADGYSLATDEVNAGISHDFGDARAKGGRGDVVVEPRPMTDAEYAAWAAEDERKTRMMCEAMGLDFERVMELRGQRS